MLSGMISESYALFAFLLLLTDSDHRIHINSISYLQIIAETVVMISVAFLVILFSVQRFGTSKVGLAVGPALFMWFCSLGIVGIYNLLKHETRVLEAFNPMHIFYFFRRNPLQAWMSLGGCLLCVTGTAYK